VSAEFHQEEVFEWLLRDATVFEYELLGAFALERNGGFLGSCVGEEVSPLVEPRA
jgi:hypothetical protein